MEQHIASIFMEEVSQAGRKYGYVVYSFINFPIWTLFM
jgi:hypothetical protein